VEERCRLEEVEDLSCSVSSNIRCEVYNSEVRQIFPGETCVDSVQAQLAQQWEVSDEECIVEVHPRVVSEFDIQLLEKRCRATEMFEGSRGVIRTDSQGFESMKMRDQRRHVVDVLVISEVELKWRRL
jgi:hypothetical protein